MAKNVSFPHAFFPRSSQRVKFLERNDFLSIYHLSAWAAFIFAFARSKNSSEISSAPERFPSIKNYTTSTAETISELTPEATSMTTSSTNQSILTILTFWRNSKAFVLNAKKAMNSPEVAKTCKFILTKDSVMMEKIHRRTRFAQ